MCHTRRLHRLWKEEKGNKEPFSSGSKATLPSLSTFMAHPPSANTRGAPTKCWALLLALGHFPLPGFRTAPHPQAPFSQSPPSGAVNETMH